MNKVYKVIWSKAKNCYVVASELAKSHTKAPKSGVMSRVLVAGVLACVLNCGFTMPVWAYSAGGGTASHNSSVAIGPDTTTGNGSQNVAIGHNASISDDCINAVAIGDGAKVLSGNSVRIGGVWDDGGYNIWGLAGGVESVSIGYGTNSMGTYSTAIGSGSKANGNYTVLIGQNSFAGATASTVLGQNSYVSTNATDSVALGHESVATEKNIVSFGHKKGDIISYSSADLQRGEPNLNNQSYYSEDFYRRLTNVSDGIDAHDVVTKGQLDAATAYYGVNSTGGTNVDGSGAIGANAIAIGKNAAAETNGGVAIGNNAHIYATEDEGAGMNLAIGDSAVSYGGMAVGQHTQVGTFENRGDNSVAVGTQTKVYGKNSAGFGVSALVDADISRATALGTNAHVSASNAIALGADSVADVANTVSVGSATKQRKIVNVADGVDNYDVSTVGQTGNKLAVTRTFSEEDGYSYKLNLKNLNGTVLDTVDLPSSIPARYIEQYLSTDPTGGSEYFANTAQDKGYTLIGVLDSRAGNDSAGADIWFGTRQTSLSGRDNPTIGMFIDGAVYQNEGLHRVLDTSNATANNNKSMLVDADTGDFAVKYYGVNSTGGTNQLGEGAVGANSIAIGKNAESDTNNGLAIGTGAKTYVDKAVAIGSAIAGLEGSTSSGSNSADIAIGNGAIGTNGLTVAIGENARATAHNSIALGYDTNNPLNYGGAYTTVGSESLSFGAGAFSSGNKSISLGNDAVSSGSLSVAIGARSVADESNEVSFGHDTTDVDYRGNEYGTDLNRRLTHVANGINDTDVATVGQLNTRTAYVGVNKSFEGWGSGDGLQQEYRRKMFGVETQEEYEALSNVYNYKGEGATAPNSVAIGMNAKASGQRSVAMGTGSKAGNASVAIGMLGNYSGNNAGFLVAVGSDTNDTTLYGNTYDTVGSYTVSLGQGALSTKSGSIAIGHDTVANGNSSLALGEYSVSQNRNEVSFGHSADDVNWNGTAYGSELNRKLTHVAEGVADHDAVAMMQLKAETLERSTQDALLDSRIGTQSADGNYIMASATNNVAQNVNILDTELKNLSDSVSDELDTKADVNLTNITETGETVIKNLAKGSVNVAGADKATVTKSNVNGVDTYTVSVKADGQVAEGNTDIVSGGTVYTALQTQKDATDTALDGKANIAMDNITDDGKTVVRDLAKESVKVIAGSYTNITEGTDGNAKTYAVNVRVNGQVADGNTGIVTGNTVYQALEQQKTALETDLSSKANIELDNISDDGHNVIKTDAKASINVIGGEYATVTKSNQSGVDTYTVDVATNGEVAENDGKLVTGDTVYRALRDKQSTIDTALANKANVDASNVTDASAWAEKLGTGVVTPESTQLVTGKTVAGETRVANDGTYVLKSNTAGQNISALDVQVKANTDAIAGLASAAVPYYSVNSTGGGNEDGTGASGTDAIAIGKNAIAKNDSAIALGSGTTSLGGIAIGKEAMARNGGTAIGEKSMTLNAYGVAIGEESIARMSDEVSFGHDTDVYQYTEDGVVHNSVYSNDLRRRLTNVADGLSAHHAATVGQIQTVSAGNGIEITETDNQNGSKNEAIKVKAGTNVTVNNDGVNVIGNGTISNGNTGLVSGGTMYGELRSGATGNYISPDNTTGDNLNALDTQVKMNADNLAQEITNRTNADTALSDRIGTLSEDGEYIKADDSLSDNLSALDTAVKGLDAEKADTDLGNITSDGETVIKNLAKGAVKVVDGTNTTVTEGTDGDVKTYAVDVVTDGQVAQGNTGIVTGGTVYDYVNEQIENVQTGTMDALATKANVDASNVADKATEWGTAIGTGTVAENDVKVVSGQTMFTELRPTDGEYIKKNKSTAENLGALDTQVKANTDTIAQLGDDKANKDLDNITDTGKEVIRELAKGSVKVVNGTHTTVTEGIDGDMKTYAVNVTTDGQVANGDTGVVSGGTVYEAIETAKQDVVDGIDTKLDGYAKVDGSNVTTPETWGDKLGTGVIAEGNKELVTGDTIYQEVRPAQDGEFVKKDKSTAENLQSLDTQVATLTSQAEDVVKYDGTDHSKVTLGGANGTIVTNVADGELSETSKDAVTGKQLFATNQEIETIKGTLSDTDGRIRELRTDVNTLQTDVTDLRTEYDVTKEQVATGFDVQTDGTKVKTVNPDSNVINFVSGDYVKLSNENNAVRIDVEATGQVADGDTNLVTGDAVYQAIENLDIPGAMDTKADKDLGNITDDGKDVVRNLAKGSVKVVGKDNVIVEKSVEDSVDVYTVSVKTDGQVAEGNEGLVTGDTVYNTIQQLNNDYARKDASNIDNIRAWGEKLGAGTVDASDDKLVSGKTVAGETRVSANGNYIQQANTAGQNLTELDRVLKETRDIAEASALTGTDDNAVHYDGADKEIITLAGDNGTIITNLKDGELSANSKDAVTGKQLFETNEKVAENTEQITALNDKIGMVSDGNYVSSDKTIGENLSALDTQLKTVSDGLDTVRTDVDSLRDTLTETANGKADTDLGNLTDDGKTVIADIAKGSVKVKGSGLATVTSAEEGQTTVYTVDVQADGMVEEGNTGLVNGGTVYNSIQEVRNDFATDLGDKADTDLGNLTDAGKEVIREAMKGDLDKKADKVDLETKANVDASNINTQAWQEKLGDGVIEEGNTGLINGGTAYRAIQNVMENQVAQADFNEGVIRIAGNPKYDEINSVDISKSDGTGRVLTGVVTNPYDANSAANVGYVNAIGENIMSGVNAGFSRMDSKINKAGAGAVAIASLMPAPMEGDEKWSLSAAVGNYHDATAGAVGVFYKPQDNVIMNLRGSFGNDENMVGGGVSIALSKSGVPAVSKAQLVKAVNAQANKITEQDKMLTEQNNVIESQNQKIEQLEAQMQAVLEELKNKK